MLCYQIILRIAFRIMKYGYLRYRVSLVSPLQSPRQFIHNRLNEPQRKSLIKAPRKERARSSNAYIHQKFSTKPTGFTVNAEYRSNYLDLEIGTITRGVREEEGEKEAEEGGRRGEREREREGEKRGETRMPLSACTCRWRQKGLLVWACSAPGVTTTVLVKPARSFFAFSFPFTTEGTLLSLSLSKHRWTCVYKFHMRAKNAAVIAHVLIIC